MTLAPPGFPGRVEAERVTGSSKTPQAPEISAISGAFLFLVPHFPEAATQAHSTRHRH